MVGFVRSGTVGVLAMGVFLSLGGGCGAGGAPPPDWVGYQPPEDSTAFEQPAISAPEPTLVAGPAVAADSTDETEVEIPPVPPLDVVTTTPLANGDPGLVAYTEPGELPIIHVAGDAAQTLPLEHTHVAAELTGYVAEVEVRQTFKNTQTNPIEVEYVFPLPENSAVYAMRMEIGERIIEASVMDRDEAKQTYNSAKAEGYTAALLEQERSSVFTQSVANVAPGEKIDVVIRYVQDLTYDAGEYEFVFPMVVGPRFMPGQPIGGVPSGHGVKADTSQVPDASRISPPILGRGERTGHDISLELVAHTGGPIGHLSVPTHEVAARRPADGSLRLTLAERDSIPNRDFVMRYRVSGEEPEASMLFSGTEEGYFTLLVHPPELDVDEIVGSREVIFVVDVSGSMSGAPIALAKDAMREAILKLRPVDTFNLITFAGAAGQVFERPRPANRSNIAIALEYLGRAQAGGGTQMMSAIDASLGDNVAPGRHRYVFFLTDGYVGNEAQIFAATEQFVERLRERGQRARVFGFGVGSSVNRTLLDGLAREGDGLTVYATSREDPRSAVNKFYRYIDRSVLRDVRVNFGGLDAYEVMPAEMPDLFASHPLIVHGRYRGAPGGADCGRGDSCARTRVDSGAHRGDWLSAGNRD